MMNEADIDGDGLINIDGKTYIQSGFSKFEIWQICQINCDGQVDWNLPIFALILI